MVDNVPGVGGFFLDAEGETAALRRYRTMADAIDDGIYQLDEEGRFVAANAAFAELTGRDREELLGSHASVAFEESDVDRAEAAIRALLDAGGDAVTLELPVVTADGERVPSEFRVSLLREDGEFRGTVGVVRPDSDDRTAGRADEPEFEKDGDEGAREGDDGAREDPVGGERERTAEVEQRDGREDARDDAERRWTRLVDAVPGMVYRCRNEPGWPMEFVSEGVADVAGYEDDAVESGEVSWGEDVIHPDERERVWEEVQEGLERDGSFTLQYRILAPDGEVRWVWERGRGVSEDGEDAIAIEGIITDVTEQKRAEQELLESERRFRSLVQAVDEYAIFMLDPDGRVVSWNDGAERIKDYAAEEIVGEHFSRFYTDEAREAGVPEANLAAALEDGVVEDEGWRVRADGSRFWANVTITAVRDDDGELEGFAKVTRDMTDRREREQQVREEKAFVESLLDAMPDLVYAFDAGGQFLRWNDRVSEVTGYADEEIAEMHPLEFVAESERDRAMEALEAVVGEGETRTIEAPLETADGERIPYQFSGAPIVDEDGAIVGLTGIGRDVSQLKAQAVRLERQRDELEAELAEVFERVDDAFYALDEEWRFTYVNDRATELLDIPGSDLLGATIWEAFPEASESEYGAAIRRAMETQEAATVEAFYPPLEAWLEVRAYPSESGLSVYFRDVTGRVERERELEEYEAIVETMNDGVYVVDADGEFVMVNDAYVEMTGYSREELLGSHVSLVVDEDTIETAGDIEGDLREGTIEEATLEAELLTADGDRVPAEATFALLPADDGGEPTRIGVVRDVTERVERERELEESERRYRTLAEHFPNGAVGVYDHDLRYTLAAGVALGDPLPSAEELEGERFPDLFPEDTVADLEPMYRAAVEAGETASTTTEFGGRTWRVWATPLRDADGEIFAGLSFAQDITEQVERERELEEQRERYRQLSETAPVPIATYDSSGSLTYVNHAGVEMMGVDGPEDLLGEPAIEFVHPADRAASEERMRRVIAEREPAPPREVRVVRPDGEVRHTIITSAPISADGEPGGQIVLTDITERKERERELEEYETIVETIPDGAYVLDEDHRYRLVNRTFAEMTGYSREELLGSHVTKVADESVVEGSIELREQLLAGEIEFAKIESELHTADGDVIPLETRFSLLPFDEEFRGTAGIARDVSERLQRERELLRQRERLGALNQLNAVVREITDATIEQSTREEIERTVCEALAAADSYEFAWIGEVDANTDAVVLRAEAGVEGYLDDAEISVDPDDERSLGPTGRAVRVREIQVVDDVFSDPDYEPWRQVAEEYGFRSTAAIPIVHEGTLYGVLNVYADRSGAFSGEERDVIGQLGEIVGHAIAAVERKRALTSDEVIELDFLIEDAFTAFDLPAETDDRITIDQTVPAGDDEYLVYGHTTEDGLAVVEAIVETVPHWESLRVVGGGADRQRFEVRLTEPPVLTALSSRGGYVGTAYFEGGDYHMTVQLPHSVAVRDVVEVVRDAYPDAEVRAQRQVTRDDEGFREAASTFQAELTDRQRAVLESAYFAGYFEWPRESSGEEIADSLDIAPATFSQHLRTAEKRIFGALFEGEATG